MLSHIRQIEDYVLMRILHLKEKIGKNLHHYKLEDYFKTSSIVT